MPNPTIALHTPNHRFTEHILSLKPMATYQPKRTLQLQIPFRATRTTRMVDSLSAQLAKRLLDAWIRADLPLKQLNLLGITPPADLLSSMKRAGLREIFRLLTGAYRHLDLTILRDLPADVLGRTSPTPTLFLSMHHGNWEWLAALLTHIRPDTFGLARAPHHPAGRWLLSRVRNSLGLHMWYDEEIPRLSVQHFEKGGLIAFLPDQRPPGSAKPGQWFRQKTTISSLPQWWQKRFQPHFWTGCLTPYEDHYLLELEEWPTSALSHWDQVLDQQFLPRLKKEPHWHFGLWHHRIVSRETWTHPRDP
jgi:hypothetical protein